MLRPKARSSTRRTKTIQRSRAGRRSAWLASARRRPEARSPILDASCAPPGELCAEAALAVGDVPHLALSLAHFSGDHDLAVRLIAALGRSHSPDARNPLLIQLGEVRTRLTARALTTLGDAKILPAIERWIPYEPYLPVRAQLATLLGALGAGDPAARHTWKSSPRASGSRR